MSLFMPPLGGSVAIFSPFGAISGGVIPVPVSLAGSVFMASGAIPDDGAGAGAGAGVSAGAGVILGACLAGGVGAGTGAGAGFSPQAVRPTATKAATRSERFIVFPFKIEAENGATIPSGRPDRPVTTDEIVFRFALDSQHRGYKPMVVAAIAGHDACQISSKRLINMRVLAISPTEAAPRMWS